MAEPRLVISEDEWQNKFEGRHVVLALNILHAIKDGTLNSSIRNGRPAPYGYDWDALRSVVLNFFGSRAWFLETDRDGVIASHSAVAGEMYPDGLRNLHAFLKSNSSVLNDQTLDIDNLLKSTFLWQNGYLTSSVKRGFLHDLLALVEARRITEVMLR